MGTGSATEGDVKDDSEDLTLDDEGNGCPSQDGASKSSKKDGAKSAPAAGGTEDGPIKWEPLARPATRPDAAARAPAPGSAPAAGSARPLPPPGPPNRPHPPTAAVDGATLGRYYTALVKYVRGTMKPNLEQLGIQIDNLDSVVPTKILDNVKKDAVKSKVTTFRGDWQIDQCKMSMETAKMHENNGVLWWLDPTGQHIKWEGQVLVEQHTRWEQVLAADSIWSWERLLASNEDPGMRRLIFPVTIPTMCHDVQDVEKSILVNGEARPTFSNLPILGGHAVVLAFYRALDRCAEDLQDSNNAQLFLKLWEACNFNMGVILT